MSSPFSRTTKRGLEETIEALDRTVEWASRIDTKNDADNLDTGFINDLEAEEKRLTKKCKIQTVEVATENFVVNNPDVVDDILYGDLTDKSAGMNEFKAYIDDQFGYVEPPSLNKENLLWLIAKESSHQDIPNSGKPPELWKDAEYPIEKLK